MGLVTGYRISQAIHAAAVLGIADLLRDGPRDSDALAAATGTQGPPLYRVLRALAAADVFREHPIGTFSLAPMGECLCSNAMEQVAPLAALFARPNHWQPWSHLLHAVRTGENAFRHVHGADPWELRSRDPDEQAAFDRAMTALSHREADVIVAAFDFSRCRRIVDVGGGQGRLLAAILAASPASSGVLFDLPQVVASSYDVLRDAGVLARCEVVGGSFFEAIPEYGDVYVLKSIIHNWGDTDAVAILRACRRAMAPDGTLLVIESLLAPPNEGLHTKLLDLHMLVALGGQERTEQEFRALLDAAGFSLVAVHSAGQGKTVIEASPGLRLVQRGSDISN